MEMQENLMGPVEPLESNEPPIEPVEPTEPLEAIEPSIVPSPPKPGDIEYTKAVKARIDEVTREKYEEKRRADALEAKVAELEAGFVMTERPKRPVQDGFKDEYGTLDEGKYNEAIIAYEDKLFQWREKQQDINQRKTKIQEVKENVVQKFFEKAESVRTKYGDFEEIINRPVFTPEMQDAIFDSEQGPEIAYHLGKNEREGKRLANLPLAQMLKEIGKLEFRFSTEPMKKQVSNAPDPINPIKGDESPAKDSSKMSDDEWFEWRKQEKLKKLKIGG